MACIKKEYLGPEKIQDARKGAKLDIFKKVAIKLDVQKQDFEVEQETAFWNSVRFRKQIPKWDKMKHKIIVETINLRRDKIRENVLLVLYKGVVYLNFISACQSGFSGRVKKCVEYFAILYQGLFLSNYASEIMHNDGSLFQAVMKKRI